MVMAQRDCEGCGLPSVWSCCQRDCEGCGLPSVWSWLRGIVKAVGCLVYGPGSAVRGIVRAGGCLEYGHAVRGTVRAVGCLVYGHGSAVRGIVRAGGCLVYGHAVRALATQAKDLGFDFCWHFQCPPFSPHTINACAPYLLLCTHDLGNLLCAPPVPSFLPSLLPPYTLKQLPL